MRASTILAVSIVVLANLVMRSEAHGRLLVPPARSSAWREDPARFPSYFDDAQMFCGGFQTQWGVNGGLCGICGEEYKSVKKFEKGGSLYRGFPVRTYRQGETIDVVVEITANHKGFFEFRLCDVANANNDGEATQECLNKNLLKDKFGRVKIPCLPGTGKFTSSLVLPATLSCSRCVLQWKYTTGNSWGTNPTDKKSCMGCGPQETFMGCSDVAIKRSRMSSSQNEWQQQTDTNDNEIEPPVEIKEQEEAESATISKSLLKRLYNELKRLKALQSQTTLVEKNEQFVEREIVGEPMYQKLHDELIARGFREKEVVKSAATALRVGDDADYHDDLIARGFREKAVRQERPDLNLNEFRLKRQMIK